MTDIECFESHPPTADRDNVERRQEIYQAGLDIYRTYGKYQLAARREIPANGIQDASVFFSKFPGQLSEKDCPLAKAEDKGMTPKSNQLNAFKVKQKSDAWGRQQSYKTHIREFAFIDTRKV